MLEKQAMSKHVKFKQFYVIPPTTAWLAVHLHHTPGTSEHASLADDASSC